MTNNKGYNLFVPSPQMADTGDWPNHALSLLALLGRGLRCLVLYSRFIRQR